MASLTPGYFTLGERGPGIHCIGSWVGPRAGLDVSENRRISRPCRDSSQDRPVRSLVTSIDYVSQAPTFRKKKNLMEFHGRRYVLQHSLKLFGTTPSLPS